MAERFFMLRAQKQEARVRSQAERVFSEVKKTEIHLGVTFLAKGGGTPGIEA
jgi:hypothetical protein